MSCLYGQSLALAASSRFQLVNDLVVDRSGSASSAAAVTGSNLYDLMCLQEDSDAVRWRGQCKGLGGFRTAASSLVATWHDMRKAKRVTQVLGRCWQGRHNVA